MLVLVLVAHGPPCMHACTAHPLAPRCTAQPLAGQSADTALTSHPPFALVRRCGLFVCGKNAHCKGLHTSDKADSPLKVTCAPCQNNGWDKLVRARGHPTTDKPCVRRRRRAPALALGRCLLGAAGVRVATHGRAAGLRGGSRLGFVVGCSRRWVSRWVSPEVGFHGGSHVRGGSQARENRQHGKVQAPGC